ncbi:MAG TPA: hypothetical protein VMD59_16740 [Acidimicrobiales bacterium]|nr:hypothetical protein [Acidimicrobiales bacterium]
MAVPEQDVARHDGDLLRGEHLDARVVRLQGPPSVQGHLSVLFPPGDPAADDASEPACFRDLNLDQMVAGISTGFDRYELAPFFYQLLTSPDSVRYRHEVFADLGRDAVREAVMDFGRRMQAMRDYFELIEKLSYRYQREGWFLEAVQLYCDAVRALAGNLANAAPASRALAALRVYLADYCAAPAFETLVGETEALRRDLGGISYCLHIRGLRVTVKGYEGEADYSPEVLATFEKFRQGETQGHSTKFRELAEMNHVETLVLDQVAVLFPQLFARLDGFAEAHRSFVDPVLARFDREIQFYLAYRQYLGKLVASGLTSCYPEVSASKDEIVRDTYDLVLASKLVASHMTTVCNDFELTGEERILVVSGPNQGGKTTFARTFGQLHHLAALGCPLPGSEARLLLADGVLTHFAAEENLAQHTGKLEDDIVRVGQLLQRASSESVVVLNEIFASTTLDDAVFLGTELMQRVIDLGVLCCCVTFIDELARLARTVSMMSSVDPAEPARRTYKVTRRPADGLAYALAIAEKYRVTYSQLKQRLSAAVEQSRAGTGSSSR